MQVTVAYVLPGEEFWRPLEVSETTTVREAIVRSGVLGQFPGIDLEIQKVGVFGKLVKLEDALRPGDRVEIYRAITCDPQTVPRRDQGTDED